MTAQYKVIPYPDVKKINAGMFVYLVAAVWCFSPSLWQAVDSEQCEK